MLDTASVREDAAGLYGKAREEGGAEGRGNFQGREIGDVARRPRVQRFSHQQVPKVA